MFYAWNASIHYLLWRHRMLTKLSGNDTANLRGMERTILFNRKIKAIHCSVVITWSLIKILPSLVLQCLLLYSNPTVLAHTTDSTNTIQVSYTFHTEIYGKTSMRPFTCSIPTSEKVSTLFKHPLPTSSLDNHSLNHPSLDSISFWNSMKSSIQSEVPQYIQFEQSTSTILLDSVLLQVAVDNFDCGGNGINRDFRKSLQSDQFPFIDIIPSSLTVYPSKPGQLETKVSIQLAGINRTYQIPVNYTMAKNIEQKVHLGHAKVVLRMSDFGITPPSPFFGLIQVDDELQVEIFILASIKGLQLR